MDLLELLLVTRRCGGCGSKVGAQVLDRALRRIRHLVPTRREVVAGVGDDAALVRPPTSSSGANMLLVHTLDYFRSFVSDPYMFGRIAAVHALSGL
jgi:selenide, water dikinase